MKNTIEQRVSNPDNWLTYKEDCLEESVANRSFGKIMSHADTAPDWDEWTAKQYDAWQKKYNPQPEPEVTEAEVVE